MAAKKFSIILPTYSGFKTLSKTLESILYQKTRPDLELIIVIDGPLPDTKKLAEKYRTDFEQQKINLKIIQFKNNQGRFEARVAGAKAASYDQLLFLEDRVYLAENYFAKLAGFNDHLMLSNVLETKTRPNIISDNLTAVRRAVYGDSWGQDFKDYLITDDNFEKSPKGLASLWVPRDAFLDACQKFALGRNETRHTSDDTGVLKLLVEAAGPIKRTSQLVIYYQPRTGFAESVKHLFERGPKFVDYYRSPGTKFFPVLVGLYLALLAAVAVIILKTIWIVWALLVALSLLVLLALRAGQTLSEKTRIIVGLPLVVVVFIAGILKGTIQAIFSRK